MYAGMCMASRHPQTPVTTIEVGTGLKAAWSYLLESVRVPVLHCQLSQERNIINHVRDDTWRWVTSVRCGGNVFVPALSLSKSRTHLSVQKTAPMLHTYHVATYDEL